MKARLNVLGRKHNIIGVVVQDETTGESKHFYDSVAFENVSVEQKVVLGECIESPSFEKKIEDIKQLLEDSKDHLKVLGEQIVREVVSCGGLPFGETILPNLAKEYKEHSDYIDGVSCSLEVLKSDNYA